MARLHFILGGIALAATGYGLKRYFDRQKNVFCDEKDAFESKINEAQKKAQKSEQENAQDKQDLKP